MANHVVNSLNFEIKVATKSSFKVVSEEISALVNQSLGELIDEIFSEIYPEQHLLVINKLEIDLGQLRVDQLRGDLTQKFKSQFTVAFKEHLKSLSVQISSSDEIPFLILDGYIRSGVRPQWLQAREANFQQHLARAFEKNPRRFSTKIRGYLRNPTYKKRVLENFSEGMLMQSVLVEHPLNSEVLSDEITRLSDFFRQQYRHLAPSSSSMLFKNMLVGILMYPQKINKLSSFRAAVASEMERQFGANVAASYQESGFAIGYSESSLSRTSELTPEIKEKLALDQRTVEDEALIQKFQFFMFHGYTLTDNRSTSYRYRNINTLFLTLLNQNFQDLVEFLLAYGKSAAIKRRFLDSLSQDAILEFFAKVAPQKRKLLEWVVDVFEQVQEDYQPINQTLIQVKKSINEITYDLFLTKNLQSISDENYLRFLFKKTAQKYGISYKNLLFLTIKSISSREKKYRVFNFSQTLEDLYATDILKKKGFRVGDLIFSSKRLEEKEFRDNYKNKEKYISVFSKFYLANYGPLPEGVINWLRTKVHATPLDSTSQLFELWKEFVKKFKLNDETLSFSALLKEKGIEVSGDLFRPSKASEAQEWKDNVKSKEEIISLFSGFYSQEYGALPEAVTNWLGSKVQSISLNGPTPLLNLWKEFVKKYKLKDELLSFSALLKEKGVEVNDLIRPSKKGDRQEWKTNFKTKEELISLLSSFYKENNKDVPVAVTDWLGIKVKSISLTNPTQLLELWKEFVKKYKLKDHTLSFSTLLKEKGVEVSDLIRTSKKSEEQEWKANFKNKEELISLLSSFYKENHATVPVGVVDWLRIKVQSISLISSTQMLELWKEFVKKYKLKVDSLSFSALLKENGFKVGDSIRSAKKEDEREWKSNFQNKEELISLFSSLYREQFGALPTEVSSWLRTRLKDLALDQSSSLFELWEDFAQTYSLPVGDLLIPILLERNVNPSIKLTVAEFNYWVKKYSIQGIYPSKPTDAVQLLSYLLTHKKVVSIDAAKKIAAGLLISLASSKAAFIKVAELIRPRLATSIPGFIVWIEQLLKENNAEALEGRVYIWLYHQFILLPSNQLTVASLQDKVSHFLQLNKDGASWTDANGFIATSMRMSSQKRRQRSLSSKMIARIFSILGTREVYAIFAEAKRYDEEILLKLLINKYSKSFYQLLDTHRFNSEFQDAILVQAPKWLKKQIIDYLLQRSTFDWNSSLSAIKSYFEENKWIKLDGASFESLIEITLWRQIFDPNPVVLEELILELLNKAMDSRLLTPKFWKDLKVYVQLGRQAKEDNSIVSLSKLEGLDGFEILVSRTGFQKEEASILPILEGLVYDAVFPVGHTFEGSPAEEYGEYISKLVLENRNEFLNLFSKVKSPILSRRFINLLEYKGLLLLIKEKHKRDSLVISMTQLERIVKAFGVREQGKVEIFLRAWLVYLFHTGTTQLPAAKLVGAVATLLLEEGILDKVNLDLNKSFDSLASLFKWTEAEKKYFFELGQNWADESLISPLSSELAGEDTLVAYLKEGQDPFLKQMKGSGFFTLWLNLFFEIASAASIKSFVALFKNSFYENSYDANKKYELFFQRFFQLKEGYDSFRQALASNPKLWLEFRKNNPNLFKEIELGVEAKKKPMTLLELLQFYISYGALPKEEGSLQAFTKRLIGIKGADLDKVRNLFLTSLVATNKKKNLLKLLQYVDEKWFFVLLHPKLYGELDLLVEEVRKRTGSNLYADLRILDKVDRILFFAEAFSKYGLPSKHVIELILPIFEQWMETKTASVIAAIFIGTEPKSELLVLIQHTSRKVKKIIEEELEKNEEEVEEEPVLPEPEELDFGIGVSVYNAGMILCWPFFGRFFAALGLVEQGKFKGQQAEERAVQLLQYLATGLTEFEEWDLSLNKVLCGVPMNTPIAPSFEITLEEEEMVNKLINGTIFNWEKMRGTRLETFRETFFMRTGMLYEKDNRWELIVERKAYDLLLDTLTWNITMINLSMMKKRLNVQWK
jgi:hypothetical protein